MELPAHRQFELDLGFAESDTLYVPTPRPAETPLERPPHDRDPSAPRGALSVGQRLAGRYTILEHIGSGGMSEVYLARHELLDKEVAVKVLRADMTSEHTLGRLHREAKAAASINDPHVIEVTDYSADEDGAFIVMERLEGADLRAVLRNCGPLSSSQCVEIIRQVLRGLSAAHARSIVHRDLKAENVFVCERDDGTEIIKLLDFGISKVTSVEEDRDDAPLGTLTQAGTVLGTPQYIAPEQAHADPDVDQRADIYAAGVLLYEMLIGELPFAGKSAIDLVTKHLREAPQPPRKRRPDLDIPPELEKIALKAMSKERSDRYATAEEMLAALPDPATLARSRSQSTCKRFARRPALWASSVMALLLQALVLVVLRFGAVAAAAEPRLSVSEESV